MIWPFLLEKTANKYVHTVANALFVWFALLVVDKKSINFVSRMFLMLHYDLIFESEIKKNLMAKRKNLTKLTISWRLSQIEKHKERIFRKT